MSHDHYVLAENDVLRYGLPTAFVLTWLRQQPRQSDHTILLSAVDVAALANLTEERLEDLQVLGLIALTSIDAGFSVQLLIDDGLPDPAAVRELKQQGLIDKTIEEAFICFTRGVHTDPKSVMGEFYHALPHEQLGPSKAFIRFALQYHAIFNEAERPVPSKFSWTPQIRTLQMLVKEGVARTFVHEKRLQFCQELETGGDRYRRPSPDHHFLEYCRRAWLAVDDRRRMLERNLSV